MKIALLRWLIVAAFTASLLSPRDTVVRAAQDANGGATPAGNVDNGKQLFAANSCNSCHGDEAEGAMGPQLASTAKSLTEFLAVLRKPKGAMPPFNAAKLSEAQAGDIYAFVKSLAATPGSNSTPASGSNTSAVATPTPASETFSATGPGNPQRGKAVFTSDGCFQCHGLEGQGATQTGAPRIGPPPIPIAAFAAYIRHPTGNMPPYVANVVTDVDVADIYTFLQSIKPPAPGKDIPLLNQ